MAQEAFPLFYDRFLQLIAQIKDEFTVERIEELLRQGRSAEALIDAEVAGLGLSAVWGKVFIDAGEQTAAFVENAISTIVSFDQVNQRAVDQMQANQLRLVREINTAQADAIRDVLVRGVREGLNPRDQAVAIRDVIGLTARQSQAVESYRHALEAGSSNALGRALRDARFDPTVARAVSGDTVLTPAQVDRMVERYEERYLAYRAETIARTEALRAANAGAREMYQQAVDDGTLAADELTRRWNTHIDGRERLSHEAMNGQERDIDEPFMSGDENELMYPGDEDAPAEDSVQCRCAVSVRFRQAG